VGPEADQDSQPFVEKPGSRAKKRGLRGKWLLFGAVAIFFIILAAGAFGVNQVVSNSSLCVNCHEMRPEYYTWQLSSHSKVACTDCHLPIDSRGRMARNFAGLRLIVKHYLGNYQVPILVWQPVSQDNCLACHSKNRQATPSGDIKISHINHDNKGVGCVSCHSGVAHGRIVERGKISEVKPQDWNQQLAAKEVQSSDIKPKMIQCLTCHREWKVSTQCEKCHSRIPTPPSHLPGTWRTMHGKAAWEDVNQCSHCHYEQSLGDNFDKQRVSDYIRANSFCVNCHLKYKPPNHTATWPHDHSGEVIRGQVPYCIVCHDINKPQGGTSPNGTFTYCNKCHGQYRVGDRQVMKI